MEEERKDECVKEAADPKETNTEVKKCAKCGATLKPEAKFCLECGSPVQETVDEEEMPTNCSKCGAPLEPGVKFCAQCGEKVTPKKKMPTNCSKCGAPLEPGAKFCQGCGAKVGYSTDDGITQEDAEANKIISVLCYFGLFMLLPFLMRPNSKFVRFHCNQGIILLIFNFVCGIVMLIPVLGWVIGIVGFIFSAVCFIMGVINALTGKAKPLPLIGKFALIK